MVSRRRGARRGRLRGDGKYSLPDLSLPATDSRRDAPGALAELYRGLIRECPSFPHLPTSRAARLLVEKVREQLAPCVSVLGFRVEAVGALRTPETEGLDDSANEAAVLATPHPDIDPRVTLAASICFDTGRTIGTVRFLRSEDVIFRDGRIHLRFWKSHDKGGKSSTVPVSHATAKLVLEQLVRDRTNRWGWLFPGQRAAVPLGGIDST